MSIIEQNYTSVTPFPQLSLATSMSFNSSNLTTKQDINMVTNPIKAIFNLDNNLDEVRGHSLDMSIHRPRSPSLLSSESEEEYHIWVKRDSNRIDENDPVPTSSSINLKYATQGGQNNQVSKMADPTLNMRM